MLKLINILIALLLLANIFIGVLSVRAEGLLPDQTGPACPADSPDCGNYSLNDIVRTTIKISEFILKIVGSLALLAFVAGGLMMMLSAGNAEWVTRGRQTLIGAVIGLTIVFTSYSIIQLVFTSLGVEKADKGKWSISNWFNK